ncbi:hypothetical protein [Mangrovimonas xylaniphaga]|uniref:hypothetical protein n=1 Tax=Mangrovimonas xylaniphaga TaxID=1645915 RepID=UPI0006B59349|nr:hypothetical protein [Mangrovimonas xylaniphaga]
MKPEFTEQQKFTQWWLWLILIPIGIMPLVGIYKQFILKEPFGDKPISDLGLMGFACFIFALVALFFVMKLTTRINKSCIEMSFFPFVKKTTKWSDIKTAQVINYGFVGGWGIRLWTKYGTVYNMKGNKGLAIELLNGKKFLIGTQKEAELTSILKKLGV